MAVTAEFVFGLLNLHPLTTGIQYFLMRMLQPGRDGRQRE